MAIQEQFEKFYENIKLTQAQRDDAKRKYDGVCGKLHSYYYPDITYDGNTRFLIGSYGKKTHIRPARDIDVIFIMPPEKFSQYNDNNSNCQSQLLQDVKAILEEKYTDTPISAFGKVVVLEFADPQHKVEVQPAWENENGTFTIPNSENGGSWEIVNPRTEIKRIKDSDEQTGKTKKLIRTIKKWSELCTAPVKSFAIENKVLEFFSSNNTDTRFAVKVRDFFSYFYNSISDESLRSHLNTALSRARKACTFEDEHKLDDATEEWKKILGDDFPKQMDKFLSEDQVYVKAPDEKFIEELLPVSIDGNVKVDIETYCKPQNGSFRKSVLLSKLPIGWIFRKDSLEFKATASGYNGNYDTKWKVRNFGEEAERANKLRGEILEDNNGLHGYKDGAAFYGEHFLECYVIKDGTCIAKKRITVPIGK